MEDKDATIDNTRSFFEGQLESLLRKANANHSDLRSPSFDGMPKAPNHGDLAEDKMMALETAREHIACVHSALDKCEEPAKTILSKRYVDRQPDLAVMTYLGYGHTQYAHLKRAALLEFADRYQAAGWAYGFDDTNLKVRLKPEGYRKNTGRIPE